MMEMSSLGDNNFIFWQKRVSQYCSFVKKIKDENLIMPKNLKKWL